MKNKSCLRPAPKTCKTCAFFNKAECGYVALQGTQDKGGNKINISFDMHHNCPDHVLKSC